MAVARERDSDRIADLGVAVGLAIGGMVLGVAAAILTLTVMNTAGVELPESISNVVLMMALQIGGLAGMAAIFLSATGRDIGYVRLRKPSLKQLGIAFGSIFAMLIAVVAVSVVIESLGQEAAEHGTVNQIESNPKFALYMIPLAVLVIGPCEEFLFRGVIQTKLRGSFGTAGAVVATSAIFSSVHVPAYGGLSAGLESILVTLSVLFVLALILGTVYEKTDNLLVPIIAHGFYNAVLFGMVYVSVEYADELEEASALLF
jgi:membrane protease YdiL (CAAX protease family)